MSNTVDSALLLSNYRKTKAQTGSNILGKDDFLKLLMAQLQNQDPTNPMQDTDFIAQMAQFSTLEQMTNMNSTFEKLIQAQEQNQLLTYQQFLGKNVAWNKVNDLGNGTTEIMEGEGKIASLQYKNNNVIFTLEDGTELQSSNISQLHEANAETSIIQASLLIGKKITFKNSQQQEETETVQSASFKNGLITFQLNNGLSGINANQIIKIE